MLHGGGRDAGAREAHESMESFRPRRKVPDIACDESRRDDPSNQKTLLHGQTQPRWWQVQGRPALETKDLERGLAETFPLCGGGEEDVSQCGRRGAGNPGRSFSLARDFDPAGTAFCGGRGLLPGGFRVSAAAAGGRGFLQTTGISGARGGTGRLRNRESEAQEKDQYLCEATHGDNEDDRAPAIRMSTFDSLHSAERGAAQA